MYPSSRRRRRQCTVSDNIGFGPKNHKKEDCFASLFFCIRTDFCQRCFHFSTMPQQVPPQRSNPVLADCPTTTTMTAATTSPMASSPTFSSSLLTGTPETNDSLYHLLRQGWRLNRTNGASSSLTAGPHLSTPSLALPRELFLLSTDLCPASFADDHAWTSALLSHALELPDTLLASIRDGRVPEDHDQERHRPLCLPRGRDQ